MRNILRIAALFVVFGTVAISAAAAAEPIEIAKSAQRGFAPPTLKIQSLEGDPAVTEPLRRYLATSGWFRVVESGEADYNLQAKAGGGTINMVLAFGGNPVFNQSMRYTGDPRRAAARAVDEVLMARFQKKLCDSRIAFTAETKPGIKEVFVCDTDGGNLRKITDSTTSCVEPGWMPDGESVVYTRYNLSGTDVCQTMLDPWRTRRLTSFPGMNVGASVHPNGNFLALVMSVDRQVELYVKSVNGREKRRLTSSKAVEASPCWSQDGQSICFVSDQSGRPKLCVVPANGGSIQTLPTLGSEAVTPNWSPDNQIVYAAKVGGNYQLAVLDLSGGGDSGLIPNLPAGDWESPAWAPDSRHVVASRRNGRKAEIYVVDTKTGVSRKLVNLQYSQSSPDWSDIRKR